MVDWWLNCCSNCFNAMRLILHLVLCLKMTTGWVCDAVRHCSHCSRLVMGFHGSAGVLVGCASPNNDFIKPIVCCFYTKILFLWVCPTRGLGFVGYPASENISSASGNTNWFSEKSRVSATATVRIISSIPFWSRSSVVYFRLLARTNPSLDNRK
jgi:hypothetical protein